MFYMNMRAYNEGEQAEAYKKRKAEEADNNYKEYMSRYDSRYGKDIRGSFVGGRANDIDDSRINDDMERNAKASNMAARDEDRRRNSDYRRLERIDYLSKKDAANRHMRRHPEQYKESSSLFESVEFI